MEFLLALVVRCDLTIMYVSEVEKIAQKYFLS